MSNNTTALIIGIIFLLGLFAGGGAVYLLSNEDSTSDDIENDSNSGENLDDDETNEFDDKSDDSDITDSQTNNTSNLKVLALHGGGESSSSFQNQQGMQDLRNALPEFEFIFAQSPEQGGVWINDVPGGKDSYTEDRDWADSSINYLDNFVENNGPFNAILGYSQGAAMIPIYLANSDSSFDKVLLFNGYMETLHHGLMDTVEENAPFDIPALIFEGERDVFAYGSAELAGNFSSSIHLVSSSADHHLPYSSDETFDQVVEFLRNSSSDSVVENNNSSNESNETLDDDEPIPLAEQCLGGHSNLAMHIHPWIKLTVRGTEIPIPNNMGIDTSVCPNAMHLLHTHDDTGKLHIETYEPITVNLSLFFAVWNISESGDSTFDPLFHDIENVTITVDGVQQAVGISEIIFEDAISIDVVFDDALPDSDGDGVDDVSDICEGHDDNTDWDNDGIPDGCDDDDDDDGVDDENDQCPGFDDSLDSDGDGLPDDCDAVDGTVYDPSDLGLFWVDKFLCQNGTGVGVDDYNTSGDDNHICSVTITLENDTVTISSNGIPNHDLESGPGCCTSAQSYTWVVPRSPTNDTTGGHNSANCPEANGDYQCAADRGDIAIAINGVPIFGPEDGPGGDAVASNEGVYEEDRQHIWLGLCHGHSGPGGVYHYHADGNCVHWHPNETAGEGWRDYSFPSSTNTGEASDVIGIAFDGYPIYGVFGDDGTGQVVEMKSSYRLKSGQNGYNGIDDYEYVSGLGHLDVCNGHFGPTPDFPQGIYHYHSTIENGIGEMGFPYFLICYHGEVSDGGDGGDGSDPCAGYGETWGPGIGPPPDGCGGGGGGPGQQSTETTPLEQQFVFEWTNLVVLTILSVIGLRLIRQRS